MMSHRMALLGLLALLVTTGGRVAHADEVTFLMAIDGVFMLSGVHLVATGYVERGEVAVGDILELVGSQDTLLVSVLAIEHKHKLVPTATKGQGIGIELGNVEFSDVVKGQVLATPGAITAHSAFIAHIYLWSKAEGGRHTPVFTGYTPQCWLRTAEVTCTFIPFPPQEMMLPGEDVVLLVTLQMPVALAPGTFVTFTEGGREVGGGLVTQLSPRFP